MDEPGARGGERACGMKIMLVGYHNPNFTNSTVYRDKAVGYLGHELLSFEDRAFVLPGRIRDRFPVLQAWDLERLNRKLIRSAREEKPDICLVVGGQRTLPQTIEAVKQMGIKTALWTTDAPVDFKNVLAAAPFYDHLFCAGTEALDIFQRNGLRHAVWLPFGCDPNYHKPVDLTDEDRKEYGKDIAFVGSYYPNREVLLEQLAEFDIHVWGPYWSRMRSDSPLKDKVTSAKLNFDQWVKIYNASKIVIVVHYQDPKVPCHQASPKLFEAMACGACVFSDNQRDVKALFDGGRHVVYFNDVHDLKSKIKFYLAHDEERRAIARQGYERVINADTYQHRIGKIVASCQK